MNRLLLALFILMTTAAPSWAQLAGTDTKPGDPCTAAEEGYVRRNASVARDSSEITLMCDGSAWQSATGSGTSGITALTGDVTASGAGSVVATIATNAIGSAEITDGSVANADLAGSIALSKLSITGTASSSVFLRGDGTWAAPSLSETDPQVGTTTASNFCKANVGGTAIDCATAAIASADISDGTVALADLAANSVNASKIVDATIALADLSATGTASATTFLRGDNTWAAPAGGGGAGDYQILTASGTWTKPAGVDPNQAIVVELWGGGGGGHSNSSAGGGGGGGAYRKLELRAGNVPASVAVTVGAGGTGGAIPTVGGTSSFGSFPPAYGGGKGHYSSIAGGSAGGGGNGGSIVGAGTTDPDADDGSSAAVYGGGAGGVTSSISSATHDCSSSVFGGGGGERGSKNACSSEYGGGGGSKAGAAGTSQYGGNGGTANVAGTAPGGGGGHNAAGARGEVRVWVIP